MESKARTSDRTFSTSGILLLGVVIILLTLAVVGAPWVVDSSSTTDELNSMKTAERLKAYADMRMLLIQIILGILFLLSAHFAWRNLKLGTEQLRLAREAQSTERFVRSLEHLGSDKDTAVQLAGVLSLREIGISDEIERAEVIELLLAFIRERAPMQDSTEIGSPLHGKTPMLAQGIVSSIAALAELDSFDGRLDLSKLDLRGVRLHDFALRGVDVSDSQLDEIRLDGMALIDSALMDAHLSSSRLSDIDLRGSNLTGVIMARSPGYKRPARLKNARMSGTKLNYAHLEGVDFIDANFAAFMERAGAAYLRFGAAELIGAYLHGSELKGARMDGVKMMSAHLESTDKDGTTDLSGASLRDATLRFSHFDNAILAGCILADADMRKTTLNGADLSNAELSGTKLQGATCSRDTRWPDGFEWRDSGVILV